MTRSSQCLRYFLPMKANDYIVLNHDLTRKLLLRDRLVCDCRVRFGKNFCRSKPLVAGTDDVGTTRLCNRI